MIAAIDARKSSADAGAGAVRLGYRGHTTIEYPREQNFALEILRCQDLLDAGRLVGWGDLRCLGHGAILLTGGRSRGKVSRRRGWRRWSCEGTECVTGSRPDF
jgi:hypothetical protein